MGRQYILSVRPIWTDLILSGEKLAEVRLSRPTAKVDDAVVWLYETKAGDGRGRIVGWCRVTEIRSLNVYRNPAQRAVYAKLSCLSEENLENYQRGRERLYFWLIEEAHELTEEQAPTLRQLGAVCPPQSWRSVKEGCEICV